MTAKAKKTKRRSATTQTSAEAKPAKPWIEESQYGKLQLAVYLVSMLLCGIISLQLGQDNNWDLRNYHYYNPFAFLTGRIGYDFAPAQMQSYLNPLTDIPHYIGMTFMPPKLYGFMMGAIHGLNIGLLFSIVFLALRKLSSNLRVGLSLFCTALGAYAPIFVGEIGASQNDTLTSLFVLGGVYCFVRVLARDSLLSAPESRKLMILGSLIFGMGVGLKLTLMIYALGAAAAFLFVEQNWKDRATVVVVWSVAFLVGFLITNGFWMVKIYSVFQNPTFPFYNNIFESPWAEVHSHSDDRWLALSLSEALLRPFKIAFDNHYTQTQNMARDARYGIVYALLILTVAVWIVKRFLLADDEKTQTDGNSRIAFARLSRAELFVLVFFVVSYVVWQVKFSTIRYTAVAELFGPLIIVSLVFALFSSGVVRAGLLATTVVAIFVALNPVQHLRSPWSETFWNVQLPQIESPENTIVLLANTRPWGYLIPLFPHELRWVRVKSNFTEPAHETKMQEEIRKVIAEHEGDILLLTRYSERYYSWITHDAQVLSEYGLTIETESARPVLSPYSRPGLFLLTVTKG